MKKEISRLFDWIDNLFFEFKRPIVFFSIAFIFAFSYIVVAHIWLSFISQLLSLEFTSLERAQIFIVTFIFLIGILVLLIWNEKVEDFLLSRESELHSHVCQGKTELELFTNYRRYGTPSFLTYNPKRTTNEMERYLFRMYFPLLVLLFYVSLVPFIIFGSEVVMIFFLIIILFFLVIELFFLYRGFYLPHKKYSKWKRFWWRYWSYLWCRSAPIALLKTEFLPVWDEYTSFTFWQRISTKKEVKNFKEELLPKAKEILEHYQLKDTISIDDKDFEEMLDRIFWYNGIFSNIEKNSQYLDNKEEKFTDFREIVSSFKELKSLREIKDIDELVRKFSILYHSDLPFLSYEAYNDFPEDISAENVEIFQLADENLNKIQESPRFVIPRSVKLMVLFWTISGVIGSFIAPVIAFFMFP